MNRADWQQIAEERLIAAQILLAANNGASAYYLAGYAVECGLKSCLLRRLANSPEIIFERRYKSYSSDCWTHKINDLVGLAGLETERDADTKINQTLGQHWTMVAAWSEESRYEMRTHAEAQGLYNAISDPQDGVMKWIRQRW